MGVPTAQRLLEDARDNRKKLTTDERRHLVAYLEATSPSDYTNQELAEMCQVTERTIRLDKQALRKKMSEELKEDDVGLIVADIIMNYRRQLRDIEASKAKCSPGSHAYLQHCVAAFNLQRDLTKICQDLGWYPKNLGNLVTEKYIYQAIVTKDGTIAHSKPDGSSVIEAEFVTVTPELTRGTGDSGTEKEGSGEQPQVLLEPSV